MEESYIVLNKWDIEDLIGNSGCAVVDDKQYYRDEIKILSASGFTRECSCVFFDATADEPIYYIVYYTYDAYNDENIIRAPVLNANPASCFTYYKIRKANSRQITEYY
jgi:hypothetical protein